VQRTNRHVTIVSACTLQMSDQNASLIFSAVDLQRSPDGQDRAEQGNWVT